MKKSPLFSLNRRDYIKSLFYLAVGTSLSSLGSLLVGGVFPDSEHWKIIVTTGVIAAMTRIIASLSENSKGEILKEEPNP